MNSGLFYSKYNLSDTILPIFSDRRYYIMFKDIVDDITVISLAKLNCKQVDNLKEQLNIAKQPINIMLNEQQLGYAAKALLSKLHILEMIPNRVMDKCIGETFGRVIEMYLKNIAKGIYE